MTDPMDVDVEFQMVLQQGEISLDKNQLEKAEELLRKALSLKPDSARALNKLGVTLIRSGRKTEARRSFEQAIMVDDRYAPAYSNLGNIYREEGNLEMAVQLYRKAIAVDPEFPTAYHNLGVVLKQQGNVSAAVDNLKKAAKLQRNYAREDLKKVPKQHRMIAYAILIGLLASVIYLVLRFYRV